MAVELLYTGIHQETIYLFFLSFHEIAYIVMSEWKPGLGVQHVRVAWGQWCEQLSRRCECARQPTHPQNVPPLSLSAFTVSVAPTASTDGAITVSMTGLTTGEDVRCILQTSEVVSRLSRLASFLLDEWMHSDC